MATILIRCTELEKASWKLRAGELSIASWFRRLARQDALAERALRSK